MTFMEIYCTLFVNVIIDLNIYKWHLWKYMALYLSMLPLIQIYINGILTHVLNWLNCNMVLANHKLTITITYDPYKIIRGTIMNISMGFNRNIWWIYFTPLLLSNYLPGTSLRVFCEFVRVFVSFCEFLRVFFRRRQTSSPENQRVKIPRGRE